MTIVCPKPQRRWKKSKNKQPCLNCKTMFSPDGRGKPLYCLECAEKKRLALNRQTYHNRKNRRTIKCKN